MNRINWKPFKEFMIWFGTVLLAFTYTLLVELLISFVTLAQRHTWSFFDMVRLALGVSLVVGIIQPFFRRKTRKRLDSEEKKWGDWHKQN